MGTKWELSPRDTQFANKKVPRAPVDLLPSPPQGQLHEAGSAPEARPRRGPTPPPCPESELREGGAPFCVHCHPPAPGPLWKGREEEGRGRGRGGGRAVLPAHTALGRLQCF